MPRLAPAARRPTIWLTAACRAATTSRASRHPTHAAAPEAPLLDGWLCRAGEKIFAEKDSQKIVVDEIAGFLLANFHLPTKLEIIIAAFLLFRFFDIMKVFPAAQLEARKNGVLLDDLVAGLYTLVALQLMLYWGLL